MVVSIVGIDHAELLAALYNAAEPLRMGILQYKPEPMTVAEAAALLESHTYFDYIYAQWLRFEAIDGNRWDWQLFDPSTGEPAVNGALDGYILKAFQR